MDRHLFDILKQNAIGVAESFDNACEVVIHDMTKPSLSNSIQFIVNGDLTNRSIGDGMLPGIEASLRAEKAPLRNVMQFETVLSGGKHIKCTLICIHDEKGLLTAIVSINKVI